MCLYIYWDTETTGQSWRTEQIIQIASICCIRQGQQDKKGQLEVSSFEHKIRPTKEIHWRATKVHKMTKSDVDKYPSFPEVYTKFVDWISMCISKYSDNNNNNSNNNNRVFFVAHNGHVFDAPILFQNCQTFGVPKSRWLSSVFPDMILVDTLKWCKTALKRKTGNGLGSLVQEFTGSPIINAHDALADARAILTIVPFLNIDWKHIGKFENMFWNVGKYEKNRLDMLLIPKIKKIKKKKCPIFHFIQKKQKTKNKSDLITSDKLITTNELMNNDNNNNNSNNSNIETLQQIEIQIKTREITKQDCDFSQVNIFSNFSFGQPKKQTKLINKIITKPKLKKKRRFTSTSKYFHNQNQNQNQNQKKTNFVDFTTSQHQFSKFIYRRRKMFKTK